MKVIGEFPRFCWFIEWVEILVQIGIRRELVAVRACMRGVRVDRGRMDVGKPSAL